MKILYCNKYNYTFSGTEAYLFGLMDLMREHGHEPALFSMADSRGTPTPYDRHFAPHVDFKGSNNFFARARLAAHAIYSRSTRQHLRRMIAEFRPDVAHVRNIYHHLSPSIFWELKAQKIPVIYHLNDLKMLCPSYNMVLRGAACERCRNGQFWHVVAENCCQGEPGKSYVLAAEAYFHKWLRTYEKCVDRFLAPSQFVRDKLVESGWDEEKIVILPHFQRMPEASPPPPVINAPVLYFGRLSAEKGLRGLLQAMKHIPQVQLQIAGEGPQRGELQKLAADMNLRNVNFLGHIAGPELERQIAASCFTVFPSLAYETMGKSILESYAWGRPVVASDLGSRRELVREGETGVLYSAGSVQQLAAAIQYLAERPTLTAKMGANARKLVREQHSPEKHFRVMIQLYEQLALRTREVQPVRKPWPVAVQPLKVAPASPRPLRVAFIGGRGVVSKYSGIETYYEEAGKRLAEMGHKVTIYCRNHFTPALKEYNGMRLVRLPTVRSKHLETVVHTALSTLHVMFSRCDIVHYHALGPALFSFLPRLMGKKTVVTVQGLDWQRKKWGRLASTVLRWGEKASAQLPTSTMVVSHTLQQHYRMHHGAETFYVPNGTKLRQRRHAQALSQWSLVPGNYALFLGRFSPEKNCHLLIEAFEKIDTSAKLVLAGGSSYSGEYIENLRKHQSERIRLLDWVSGEDLDELLTNAALFVMPSDLEGLSLAVLDAMGAGVCVLTSDVPENRELVEGAGYTFLHGDVDDLRRMLRLLLSQPEMREFAVLHARERIQEHYLWPQIAKQVEQVYRQTVA